MPLICFFLLICQLGYTICSGYKNEKQGKLGGKKNSNLSIWTLCTFKTGPEYNIYLNSRHCLTGVRMFPWKGHIITSWLLIALLICLTFSHFLQLLVLIKRLEKVPKFRWLKWLSQQNGFCGFPSLLRTLRTCHSGKTVAVWKKKGQCECWCCGADEVWRCPEDARQVNTW